MRNYFATRTMQRLGVPYASEVAERLLQRCCRSVPSTASRLLSQKHLDLRSLLTANMKPHTGCGVFKGGGHGVMPPPAGSYGFKLFKSA